MLRHTRRAALALVAAAAALLVLTATCTAAQAPVGESEHMELHSALYRSYRHAIPSNILSRMESDCRAIHAYEDAQPALADGKRVTRWFPVGTEPRTALEEAILHLAALAKAGPTLVGYEWWVQAIGGGAPLGFHVDKDEAVASIERYLLHPIWSSVFYVTQAGGGTLIMNQLSPRGSGYEPVVATEAAWSFPEPNKFLLFNGTLLHGVVPGHLTGTGGSGSGVQRITFLVNFWHVRPKEPNCKLLRHEDVPGLRVLSKQQLESLRAEHAAAPSPKPKRQPLTKIDMTTGSTTGMSPFRMDLPGGSHQMINLPVFETPPAGQTFHLQYQRRKKPTAAAAKKAVREVEEEDEDDEEEGDEDSDGELSALARQAQARRDAKAREKAELKARRKARRAGKPVPPSPAAAAREKAAKDQQAQQAAQRAQADAHEEQQAQRAASQKKAPAVVRQGSLLERLDAARAIKDDIRERFEL